MKKEPKKRKGAAVFASGMRGAEPPQDLGPGDSSGSGEVGADAPEAPPAPPRAAKAKAKEKARDAYTSGMRGRERRPDADQ